LGEIEKRIREIAACERPLGRSASDLGIRERERERTGIERFSESKRLSDSEKDDVAPNRIGDSPDPRRNGRDYRLARALILDAELFRGLYGFDSRVKRSLAREVKSLGKRMQRFLTGYPRGRKVSKVRFTRPRERRGLRTSTGGKTRMESEGIKVGVKGPVP